MDESCTDSGAVDAHQIGAIHEVLRDNCGTQHRLPDAELIDGSVEKCLRLKWLAEIASRQTTRNIRYGGTGRCELPIHVDLKCCGSRCPRYRDYNVDVRGVRIKIDCGLQDIARVWRWSDDHGPNLAGDAPENDDRIEVGADHLAELSDALEIIIGGARGNPALQRKTHCCTKDAGWKLHSAAAGC
jgi:hypothetical protein